MNRQILSCLLAGCLLVLNGLAYPQTVAHAGHHAHHTAKTHASALCSWICAAGQVFEGTSIILHSDRRPIGLVGRIIPQAPASPALPTAFSRGPPVLHA